MSGVSYDSDEYPNILYASSFSCEVESYVGCVWYFDRVCLRRRDSMFVQVACADSITRVCRVPCVLSPPLIGVSA